jgi:hypothetical protein
MPNTPPDQTNPSTTPPPDQSPNGTTPPAPDGTPPK